RQAAGERDLAVVAERRHRLSCARVEREQTMTAVEEQAHLIAIAPDRGAAQLPAAARQYLTELVGGAIEPPPLLAGLRIERGDAVVRRRHVQRAVDHQRRRLELTRHRVVFLERRLPVLPLPRLL